MLVVIALCSCSNAQVSSSGDVYNIYYINEEVTSVVTQQYHTTDTDTNQLVDELLVQLYSEPEDKDSYVSKPDTVNIENYVITDKMINIYFDDSYNNMDNLSELLCRAALVLTLTQVPGIDYVSIFVDEQPLMDSNNNPIGALQSNDFIDIYGNTMDMNKTITTVLYYANEEGDRLIPYTYTGTYTNNESIEQFIIEKLKEGSSEDNLYSTIPDDVELISVTTIDGICYVNFDESFLVESLNINDDIAIYSIVNSLCENEYISKVQISINGKVDQLYHESVSLNTLFIRNLDIVESNAAE